MNKSPVVARWILGFFLPYRDKEYLLGDYELIYNEIRDNEGKSKAYFWYWFHVVRTVPLYIINSINFGGVMLFNYIKVAFRNMKRQKTYAVINTLGLATGIVASLLIAFWVLNELSYDKYNKNAERIYRLTQHFHYDDWDLHQTQTPGILAPTILDECPEAEYATRVMNITSGTLVTVENKKLNETEHGFTDNSFFKVFSFPLLKGDPDKVLVEPNTVVLSEDAVKKYFGESDPIGKTLTLYEDDFKVVGIYKNIPANTHFHFDLLCSIATYPEWSEPNWGINNFKTYVMLKKGAQLESFEHNIEKIIENHMFKSSEEYHAILDKGNSTTFPLQKLTDIHLNSHLLWEFEANGDKTYVDYFTIIAFFIMIIAIVNYVNLSTARSTGRAREVGIRKAVGSSRNSLVRQFLVESILTSLLALLLALIIIQLVMPAFRNMVGSPGLTILYWDNPMMLAALVVLVIMVGALAGIYPSLLLSNFKPIEVLHGKISRGFKGAFLRNGLVIFQFTMSTILLVGTFIVKDQMEFFKNHDVGYKHDQVLVIKTYGDLGDKAEVFKERIKQNSSVIAASASTSIPGKRFNNIGMRVEGENSGHGVNIFAVDKDFLDVMQMKMADGRFFSDAFTTDSMAVIMNESQNSEYSNNILDKNFLIWTGRKGGVKPFKVIGIIKDFNYESFYEHIKPLAIVNINGVHWDESYLSIRIKPNNVKETIAFINKTWKDMVPDTPFEFSFLDDVYNDLYKNEERTNNVFTVFTLFALFVACLGLLGLSSFSAEQRIKEVGIRKVLGATISNVVVLLSKEFVLYIIAANLLAWPIAYWAMNNWLQSFVYRTDITIWVFVYSILLALAATLITVGYQALKAAVANPIDSIKYE